MRGNKPSGSNEPLLGARIEGQSVRFGALATRAASCSVRLFAPDGRLLATHPMRAAGDGYFEASVNGAGYGSLYKFALDGQELSDPYARWLPAGVHGPAMVIEPRYAWRFGAGVSRLLSEQVIYELHIGTFTPAGTYAAAIEKLHDLAALGVTTLELMPLAAFDGARGWGYDGVALYAPHQAYGTPDELRRLVDEAHQLGLAVLLDVVYNHLGPAGNYLAAYSPEYFTKEFQNAWGDAPNFANPAMRRYVLDSASAWLTDYRFDGLRLDATHAIFDSSPRHILRELADRVATLAPKKQLMAEDDRNDPALVTELGLHAVWADDFHHHVRVTLTGERDGYFAAYEPGAQGLADTINRGWFYHGQPCPPKGEPRGKSAGALSASSFVYCIQNHDQVGNRALGDRLSSQVSFDAFCAASMLLLCLPMTPLLFMGQEWAASSPFQYFTDHEEGLGRLISEGRRKEFASFAAFRDEAARAAIPDPQAAATFERSRLKWEERTLPPHARVLDLYQNLLKLRRTDPVLRNSRRENLTAEAVGRALVVRLTSAGHQRWLVANLAPTPVQMSALTQLGASSTIVLASSPIAGSNLPPWTSAWISGAPIQSGGEP